MKCRALWARSIAPECFAKVEEEDMRPGILASCTLALLIGSGCGGGGGGSGTETPGGDPPTDTLPSVTAELNGVVVALENRSPPNLVTTRKSLDVKSGDHVKLTASKAMPFPFHVTSSGARIENETYGTRTWEGTVFYNLSTPGGEGAYTVDMVTGGQEHAPVLEVVIIVTE